MQGDDRLRRLVDEEIAECTNADVEERVETLQNLKSQMDTGTFETDTRMFSRLGDDTRYTIVRLLHAAEKELCSCEIDPIVDVSESARSHALSDLVDVGLVERRKDGRWRYYTTTEKCDSVLEALDSVRQ